MSDANPNPQELNIAPSPPRCPDGAKVEIITAREVPLGGPRAMTVRRTLPQKQRSLIGAWCFMDHYGPDDVSASGGMDVAPHPHTGLQTVSWLFEGTITHHDSGGHHAVVFPGEVNLMTAGAGICHSEVSTQETTTLHGVQLWTALPDAHRHGPRRFDHHAPKAVEFDGGQALVFLGTLFGDTSPVTTFTPLVGAEIRLAAGATVSFDVDASFEHGLLVDAGEVDLEGVPVARGELAYTGTGETQLRIRNTGDTPARMVFIGGEPFTENILMWWNFIGREYEEIEQFREQWQAQDERFGHTYGYIGHHADGLSWLPAPELPHSDIKPRINPESIARPEERI